MAKLYNKQPYKTPVPVLDPHERAKTFDEVSLGYSDKQAINEAKRCMQCKKAPCVSGCPVGVPCRDFIAHVAKGDFARGYAAVKTANSLPAVCGRVCPQESQCEGKCVRTKMDEAVAIGRLERFVADWAARPENAASAAKTLAAHARECADAEAAGEAYAKSSVAACNTRDVPSIAASVNLSGKSVAIVGSGPAGLTCAGELAKHGAAVTVFEALHDIGGVLAYGIPEFRLPKDLLAREVAAIEDVGVDMQVNVVIGKLFTIEELMKKRGFDAVFISTGAGVPSILGIEGEGLNGVITANELLTRVNLMKAYKFPEYDTPIFEGKHCVVVGGGNVAMDAARTARRLGSEVTVVYRRGMAEMPARAEEVRHAQEEGIKFATLNNPTRILGNEEGWIAGVEVICMELGEPDASGRRSPVAIEGSEHIIECDMFVIAVGSKTNTLIADTTEGLESSGRHLIVVDPETNATSVPGVFAGGDAVIGAATVILAMGAGKRAAWGIAKYLSE